MGEVYRARDTRLNRAVAIKVLPESFASDADRLLRFEHEAQVLSALNHPNLLSIYDVGTQGEIHYLVSEFLEGQTLRERIGGSALPQRRAAEYALQIASGLAAAHDKGIVHRDLKPDNVFVTRDERLKILDFGLAKQTQPAKGTDGATLTGPTPTAAGMVLGTVGYMSPEQVRAQPTDHRSDIFSFGAILYELVSGKRAFKGESSIETMNAIVKEEPPELGGSSPQVSPGLERIIRRCLEKAPERRFQSASDLAFALEALSGTSSGITARVDRASDGSAAKTSERGKLLRWVGAAVVLLACVGLGYFFAKRGAGESASLENVAFPQLSFRPEFIPNARFAPDGETVLFSSAADGNIPELFIHRPDYPAPQSMGLGDAHLLSISSKGDVAVLTHAVYLAQRLYRGTLSEMPLGGGAPREILQDVQEADWSPDGKLAIIREVEGKNRLEFPIGKVLHESSGYLSDLRFSPRGDRIAFLEHAVKYDDRGSVNVVDLAGHATVLSNGYQSEEGLAWAPDGKEIFFSGQVGNGLNLIVYRMTLAGQRRTVLAAPDDLWVLDVSKDGKLLVNRGEYNQRIMALAPGAKSEQEMSWLDGSNSGVLSSDGRNLLFSDSSAMTGLNYVLCWRQTNGSPVVRLGEGNAQGLSPDGKWALSAVPSTPMRLVLYPTGAGEPKTLENGNIQSYQTAAFFPDGKRVLACGSEAGQATRCYEQNVAGGAPRAVTPPGTTFGRISPDGNSILARDADGKYASYLVDGGAARPVPGTFPADEIIRWSKDGRSLLIYRHGEVPARVERLDLATGKRVPVRQLAPPSRAGVLDIRYVTFADDEQSYAYSYTRVLCRLAIATGVK